MDASAPRQLHLQRTAVPPVGGQRAHTAAARGLPAVGGPRTCVEAAPRRVAILDRDTGFMVVLAKRLERLGWGHEALAAKSAAATVAAADVDALVLDPAVLGTRGWSWLERLCHPRPSFAIVVCTGSSSVAERVRALRLGVDDWLSKPCHPEELIARLERITSQRRPSQTAGLEPIPLGEVEIRLDLYQAYVGGRSLRLTRREFQLIELLSRAGGEVLAREHIYERMWGHEMIRNDRSVDVFVHKLRRKLERASPQWRYIHTHFGVGYRLAPEMLGGSAIPPEEIARPDEVDEPLAA